MRRIACSITVALALLLLASDAVLGCVCGLSPEKATPEQARAMLVKDYSSAFAVFSGQVIAVDRFKVKFKIDKLWKGDFGDEIVMSTGAKDNGDGTFTTTSCDYRFGLAEKHLVYAYGSSLEEMRAYKCTRTRLLKYAEQEMKDLDEFWPHVQKNIDSTGGDKEGQLHLAKPINQSTRPAVGQFRNYCGAVTLAAFSFNRWAACLDFTA
jgi:hypothetical protein